MSSEEKDTEENITPQIGTLSTTADTDMVDPGTITKGGKTIFRSKLWLLGTDIIDVIDGRITENMSSSAQVTSTYYSKTNWYRVWSDGMIEQGGKTDSGGYVTVTLLKPYRYYVMCALTSTAGADGKRSSSVNAWTLTTVTFVSGEGSASSSQSYPKFWYVCGR